jgi:hypothetical protein
MLHTSCTALYASPREAGLRESGKAENVPYGAFS